MNEMLQNCIIIIDKDQTNDNVRSCLSIFHCHMIHASMSLILACWSSCVVVSIVVEVLVCV
jgi:hypothetical protein